MYGYDPDQLSSFITHPKSLAAPWGSATDIVMTPNYALQQWTLNKDAQLPTRCFSEDGITLYVESGLCLVEFLASNEAWTPVTFETDHLIKLPAGLPFRAKAPKETTAYLFGKKIPPAQQAIQDQALPKAKIPAAPIPKAEPSSDYRDKYWGNIRTMVTGEVAGKRLLLQAGNSGSLEFHVKKHETYYIHSGEMSLLLRAGRAENRVFTLSAGDVAQLPQGLMHQRGALADTVIIEISTSDSDSDSFLVEDGTRSPMQGFRALYEAKTSSGAAVKS